MSTLLTLDEILGVPVEGLTEQAHLIERGVRPMVLFSPFPGEGDLPLRVATRLETASLGTSAIPFVIDRGDGTCDCGFAAERWVVELFRWIATATEEPMHGRIMGLLLGYSAAAICEFEQRQSVREFTVSVRPESS